MAKFTANGVNARIQKYDGAIPLAAVATNLTATNPASFKVPLADIDKFRVGDTIAYTGAPAAASTMNVATHVVTAVNYTTGVVSVTLSGAAWTGGPFNTAGMLATPRSNAVNVAITSLSNAKPAVATVAAADIVLFTKGQTVVMTGTGQPTIDGRAFRVGTVGATTFEVLGSDLRSNGTAITAGTASPVRAEDMLLFCLTSLEREVEAADPIDVSTMCGAEQLAGTSTPGTVSIEGFVNYDELAYLEFMKAVQDGIPRAMTVDLPSKAGSGQIVYMLTPSGFTETFEVNEAASFEGEAIVNANPVYLVGADTPT